MRLRGLSSLRQRLRQDFRRDDERPDGNDLLLQRGRRPAGIAAGADEDFARPERRRAK